MQLRKQYKEKCVTSEVLEKRNFKIQVENVGRSDRVEVRPSPLFHNSEEIINEIFYRYCKL
jgi:hypothetical protein